MSYYIILIYHIKLLNHKGEKTSENMRKLPLCCWTSTQRIVARTSLKNFTPLGIA